ncbi:MAG: hypothetical protein [Microviridae sp.]|nr:MAG: hypothetical protein [Microviridae sp.]
MSTKIDKTARQLSTTVVDKTIEGHEIVEHSEFGMTQYLIKIPRSPDNPAMEGADPDFTYRLLPNYARRQTPDGGEILNSRSMVIVPDLRPATLAQQISRMVTVPDVTEYDDDSPEWDDDDESYASPHELRAQRLVKRQEARLEKEREDYLDKDAEDRVKKKALREAKKAAQALSEAEPPLPFKDPVKGASEAPK